MAVASGGNLGNRLKISDTPVSPPFWMRLFFFIKVPDRVDTRQWRLLGLLGTTVLINHYDFGLLSLALPQIQHGLSVAEEDIGPLAGMVRTGAVLSFLVCLFADRVGRKRLLLLTIVGFTTCTTLTALAPTAQSFIALQFLARAFVTAEEILAIVVIAEELNSDARGFGLGVLAAFGALGHGVAAVAYGFVDQLPYGWRALYLVGAVPLLLLAWIRRGLPETRRFERERETRGREHGVGAGLQPLLDLARVYPGRIVALVVAILPAAFVMSTSAAFVSKTLREVHGWVPGQVTVLFLAAGFIVFGANALAGSLSDRYGRRRIVVFALALNAFGVATFYNGEGLALIVAWTCMMAGFVSADVLFGAFGTELFPTSHRSTASGVRSLAWVVGGAIGLFLEGSLFVATGSHTTAITWMLGAAWISPLVIVVFLPETAMRELEEIAPELLAK